MIDLSAETDLSSLLTPYRIGVGVVVPVAIVLIGAVGKKVGRGYGAGWDREDVYAGTELTLAGLSGILVNLFEFLKPERVTFGPLEKKLLGGNLFMLMLAFLAYLFTLAFKQDFGPQSGKSRAKQLFVMAGISNIVGFFVLFAALVLMAP